MSTVLKDKPWKFLSHMGDSLTNNDSLLIAKVDMVPFQVEKRVGGNCKSINLGISGNTTTQMLARFSKILSPVPTVAVIYGGINDVVGTDSTQTNIESMIDQLRNAGCNKIVVCNIHTIRNTDSSFDTKRTAIQTAVTNKGTGVVLCDYHAVALNSSSDYKDDTHLNEIGLGKLADKLKTVLDAQGWASVLQN